MGLPHLWFLSHPPIQTSPGLQLPGSFILTSQWHCLTAYPSKTVKCESTGFALPENIAFYFWLLWISMRCSSGFMLENNFHVRGVIVHLTGAYRLLRSVWHHSSMWVISCKLREILLFHCLPLTLQIKNMDDCVRALTGEAPYAGPVGTLLRFFMHKDSEIAELVYCFSFLQIWHSNKQADFSPWAKISRQGCFYSFSSVLSRRLHDRNMRFLFSKFLP